MLGIVIGISSVILMTSIGKGAESLILGQIQGFGSTNVVVEPGKQPSGPSSFTEIFTNSLTMDDVESIHISRDNGLETEEIVEVRRVFSEYKRHHPESSIKLIEF